MRQFVLPASWDGGPRCLVPGREARHLVRVLRLGLGDRFPAIDAEGRRHVCEILDIAEGSLSLSIDAACGDQPGAAGTRPLPDLRGGTSFTRGRKTAGSPGSPTSSDSLPGISIQRPDNLPRIILAAAILKGEKFDLVLRQAAETGVVRVVPFTSTRSFGATVGTNKRQRQERIVREALQQSGSTVPTRIDDCTRLVELPDRLGAARGRRLSLVLHEAPLADIPLHRYLGDPADEIVICVGPEGGFSPEEIGFLRERGFLPLRLPGAVLRAETAAIFAIAAVEVIYSEHGSWNLE